jgi:Spy/CpxP family protein refolding chaperone
MPTDRNLCRIVTLAMVVTLGLWLAVVEAIAREPGGRRPPQGERQPREREQPGRGGPQRYSIEQAVSDQAQLHTIAFSGLAFLTGDFGAATFLPPGKVCDFFGFQYMRDIDAAEKGHNPMFLNRVAGNVLSVLDDRQRGLFVSLAHEQAGQLRELAVMRLPLVKVFYSELQGQIPVGSQGLNKDAVVQYVDGIFAFDAEISYRRAEVFGDVVQSLTPEQKAYLGRMKFGDFNTWPDVDAERYKMPQGTPKLFNVAYMTYASELFSWYAGSVEADTYFCPERHGTYFGGFYMKDMPAMGRRDFDISTSLTGDSGRMFLDVLMPQQRAQITAVIDRQRPLLQQIIEVRRSISTELRKFLSGQQADRQRVLALGRRYGELDGEMSYCYVTAFAKVNESLSTEQRVKLAKLRNLGGYKSASAYIYSQPIAEGITLPDTDRFFFPPKHTAGNAQ